MNALERAVIEAARAAVYEHFARTLQGTQLAGAVDALDEHERANAAAGITEVPWAKVAEGDWVQGKSGTLYPVVATKREWKLGRPTGKFVITIDMAQGRREIIRPSEAQPEAVVKRGAAGAAVDVFVNVFESGPDAGL